MQNDSTSKITDIIYFHGVTLHIITHDNTKYIPAKPLIEVSGNVWRRAKVTIEQGDNAILYDTKRLKLQNFDIEGHTSVNLSEVLCIRFDRIYIYLARINTNMMKAKGNINAAEQLLQLQIEWAKVLHDYETHGIAIKEKSTHTELMQIMKMRQMAIGNEKQVFTEMLEQKLQNYGLKAKNSQADLFKG